MTKQKHPKPVLQELNMNPKLVSIVTIGLLFNQVRPFIDRHPEQDVGRKTLWSRRHQWKIPPQRSSLLLFWLSNERQDSFSFIFWHIINARQFFTYFLAFLSRSTVKFSIHSLSQWSWGFIRQPFLYIHPPFLWLQLIQRWISIFPFFDSSERYTKNSIHSGDSNPQPFRRKSFAIT